MERGVVDEVQQNTLNGVIHFIDHHTTANQYRPPSVRSDRRRRKHHRDQTQQTSTNHNRHQPFSAP